MKEDLTNHCSGLAISIQFCLNFKVVYNIPGRVSILPTFKLKRRYECKSESLSLRFGSKPSTLNESEKPMTENVLKSRILDYGSSGYAPTHFKQAICAGCNSTFFNVLMNEDEGVAARICTQCGQEKGIADSDDFFDEVEEVYPQTCRCGGNEFELMVGLALYADSIDVRWLYLGLKCKKCGLAGVYGDWKNEYNGYKELLDRI